MNEADLTDLLRHHASRHSVPGAAIGILREGAVTTAYCGMADVTSGESVTAETQFSAGSLTKSMVATVIARLAEAGRLSLDDPVATHVPELRGSVWAEGATLRDLLANRSGLPLRLGLEFDFDGRKAEDDGALSRFAADVAAGAVVPLAAFGVSVALPPPHAARIAVTAAAAAPLRKARRDNPRCLGWRSRK